MITPKKLVVHIIILTSLVLSIIISERITEAKLKEAKGPLFTEFNKEEIFSIEIRNSDSLLLLDRKANTWLVRDNLTKETNGYSIDTNMIQKIFNRIPLLTKEKPISKEKSAYERMGVTRENGIEVKLFDKGKGLLHHFYVGKKARIWSHSYFRKEGENTTYSVGENIRFAFGCNLVDWRDKKIQEVQSDSLSQIFVSSAEQGVLNIALSPEKTWFYADSTLTEATDSLVKAFINEFNPIITSNWLYAAKDDMTLGFIKPRLTIGYETSSGKRTALIIGNEDAGRPRFFVKSSESDQVFFLFKSKVLKLENHLKTLLRDKEVQKESKTEESPE